MSLEMALKNVSLSKSSVDQVCRWNYWLKISKNLHDNYLAGVANWYNIHFYVVEE